MLLLQGEKVAAVGYKNIAQLRRFISERGKIESRGNTSTCRNIRSRWRFQSNARVAEAERERRAKVINAEGEFQASERLKDAALVIEEHPIALQLRYLQTLLELGSSQATTIVFPAPIDLITPFLDRATSTGKT